MTMTYQEFKDYLVTFLWKTGDSVLIANLDNLIIQGEATLNRELREEARHESVTLSVSTDSVTLPVDYYSMQEVADGGGTLGEFAYVRPSELSTRRQRSNNQWQPVYSLQQNNILFCGPSGATAPRDVFVDYTRKIRDFATDDASWLTTDNLDLLVYAVLYHTAPFLREDERVQLWQGMYKDIINTMNEQSAHEKQRGVYGATPLPRQAAGHVRKGQRGANSFKLHSR